MGNGPGEDWYWFDYGNVPFIAYPEEWSGAWSDWRGRATPLMDQAEADPAIRFIVTFGHRPAYSSGYHNRSSSLRAILDTLGAHHAKYVLNLNGHSHNYRLADVRTRFDKIAAAGKDARQTFDTLMTDIKDQSKFLGLDLNPSAIEALKPNTAKFNARVTTVFAKTDGVTKMYEEYIASMKP